MKQKIKDMAGKFSKLSKPFSKIREPKLSSGPKLNALNKLKSLKKVPSFRRKDKDNQLNQAIDNLPRITNETVAEHREEMLSSARKFIYPLQHSRGRIVKISVAIFALGLIVFGAYILVSLYKLQSSSTFVYGVTRVLPFPVAKAGTSWVSYESYLFELRHLTHYYETQQEIDFDTKNGETQLTAFKKRAMQQVIDDAYVKQLARDNDIDVSSREVDDAVALLRSQNRLGTSDEEFANVLKEFWGWSADDFRRALTQQLLTQKVVAKLDTATTERAAMAEVQLKGGADFAKLAASLSDDQTTKASGGAYSFQIDRGNRDLSPKVIEALFKLQPGQTSGVIDTGYSLEIVKLTENKAGKLRAAHISFVYKGIGQFLTPLQEKSPPGRYIDV